MKDLNIDAMLSAMEKPTTNDSLKTVLGMLEQADVVLKQLESVMTRLDSMGLKPLLVRGLGAKLGIDAETPLKTGNQSGEGTNVQGKIP
jgi:hypothetical protein